MTNVLASPLAKPPKVDEKLSSPAKQSRSAEKKKAAEAKRLKKHNEKRVKAAKKMTLQLDAFDDWLDTNVAKDAYDDEDLSSTCSSSSSTSEEDQKRDQQHRRSSVDNTEKKDDKKQDQRSRALDTLERRRVSKARLEDRKQSISESLGRALDSPTNSPQQASTMRRCTSDHALSSRARVPGRRLPKRSTTTGEEGLKPGMSSLADICGRVANRRQSNEKTPVNNQVLSPPLKTRTLDQSTRSEKARKNTELNLQGPFLSPMMCEEHRSKANAILERRRNDKEQGKNRRESISAALGLALGLDLAGDSADNAASSSPRGRNTNSSSLEAPATPMIRRCTSEHGISCRTPLRHKGTIRSANAMAMLNASNHGPPRSRSRASNQTPAWKLREASKSPRPGKSEKVEVPGGEEALPPAFRNTRPTRGSAPSPRRSSSSCETMKERPVNRDSRENTAWKLREASKSSRPSKAEHVPRVSGGDEHAPLVGNKRPTKDTTVSPRRASSSCGSTRERPPRDMTASPRKCKSSCGMKERVRREGYKKDALSTSEHGMSRGIRDRKDSRQSRNELSTSEHGCRRSSLERRSSAERRGTRPSRMEGDHEHGTRRSSVERRATRSSGNELGSSEHGTRRSSLDARMTRPSRSNELSKSEHGTRRSSLQ